MARNTRVKMRHPKLSKSRNEDVTVEVREDQVAVHEKSGWERVEKTARPAAKTTEKKEG